MGIITKDELRRAVKGFRESLRDDKGNPLTQGQFAPLLGVGLSTLQRYEQLVPPRGKVLARLASLAAERESAEFEEVFTGAFAQEMGAPSGSGFPQVTVVTLDSHEERLLLMAFFACLRDERYSDLIPAVLKALGPVLKGLRISPSQILAALRGKTEPTSGGQNK